MAWRLARSLKVLRTETRRLYPGTTVWDIGDPAHQSGWSDHNPSECCDVVCATDTLGDAGLDLEWFAQTITRTDPPALKYVIWNRRIWFPQTGWHTYSGSNPHTSHVHTSVGWGPDGRSTGPYDDVSPWGLLTNTEGGDDVIGLRKGDSGQRVKYLQIRLDHAGFDPGDKDGDYGPKTSAAVLKMRKAQGSSASSGDEIDAWAAAQLDTAYQAEQGKTGSASEFTGRLSINGTIDAKAV